MRIKPRLLIESYKRNNKNAYLTASELGIHPTTVYRWVKLATTAPRKISSRNLHRKSTKPKSSHSVLKNTDKAKIEEIRRTFGRDAQKITSYLKLPVSHKTTHRFLSSKGLVRKYGYHRRPLFQNTGHMNAKNTKTIGYLQMDVKFITPELSGLPWTCFEYAVIDIFSRYKEAVILNHVDQDASILALLEIIPRLPFKPIFLQTDNGLEFQTRFRKYVEALGLKYHYIHKNTPNENAIIERSFRTDEEEFFFRLNHQPSDYDELKSLFSNFLTHYNTIRPHLGINLKTPYEVVANVLSG